MFSGDTAISGGAVVVVPRILAQVASAGDEASSRLTLVIIGLLVLAVVITVITVVFWRMTRPGNGEEATGMRWSNVSTPAGRDETAERG